MGSTELNLQSLERHLNDQSYIDGHAPTQEDVKIFKTFTSAPDSSKYPHSSRWWSHIKTFENEFPALSSGNSQASLALYGSSSTETKTEAAEDEDIDLFASDEEADKEAEKLKQQRVAAAAAKKAPAKIAKSVVTMDVKPWDDQTDMVKLEECVRSIHKDGLVWGLSKLEAVGYGVRKLQITIVIEDEKISLDELQDQIAEFDEYVQSSDVIAMQKI